MLPKERTASSRAKLFAGLNQRVRMEGDVMIVPLCEPLYGLWQKMRNVDGSHIYLKQGEEPYR